MGSQGRDTPLAPPARGAARVHGSRSRASSALSHACARASTDHTRGGVCNVMIVRYCMAPHARDDYKFVELAAVCVRLAFPQAKDFIDAIFSFIVARTWADLGPQRLLRSSKRLRMLVSCLRYTRGTSSGGPTEPAATLARWRAAKWLRQRSVSLLSSSH